MSVGNNVKRIFRQRTNSRTMLDKMFETSINQKIIQNANRRSRRSFLVNRVDGLLQNKKILDNNVAQVRRTQRKKEKHAKNSDSDIVFQNDYKNDDDADEENALLGMKKLRGFPIWQIPESTVTTINLDSLISTRQVDKYQHEMVNPLLFTFEKPSLQNLDSDHFFNKATLPTYPNLQEKFGTTISDKSLMFPKISNPKFEIDSDINNHAFKNLTGIVVFPTYPGLFVDIDSPNLSQFQKSQWQYSDYQQNHPSSYNIKRELLNNYLMSSKKKFILIPIFNDLYILKNMQDNNRTNINKINSKQYKLSNRKKNNTTSAIVLFKEHLHHDVKNVDRAYFQKSLYNHYFDNAKYISSNSYSKPHVSEENGNPTAPLYLNFLYPTITSSAHLNLIDAISEISIEQITSTTLNYETYTSINNAVESYDSIFLSTSFSFEILNDVSLYSEKNTYYLPNILPTTKLNDINSFKLNSSNYEDFPINTELNVEMTTIDFRNTLGIFDNNLGTLVTLENVRIYSTNAKKEVFDLIQSTKDESKLFIREKGNKYKTNFNNILMQHRSILDIYTKEDNTSFLDSINFINNDKNVLNNHDNSVQNNSASGTPVLNKYSDKKSSNNLNYNNRFLDKVLFNDNTKIDSYFKTENYIIEQSNTENPYTLLMAIKPLSPELQKLLNAVKLFNQSISNMQNKLYDKKDVRLAKINQENKEKKRNIANHTNNLDYYNSNVFVENLHKKFSNKKQKSISENRNTIIQIFSDLKSKRGTKSYVQFLNKITTPLYKYTTNKLKIQNDRKHFLKNIKLNKRKFFKSDNIEKHRLFFSRFNRNLKSLTKNYEPQVKPIRQFITSRFKELSPSTTPIIMMIMSHLIGHNISNKNTFLTKHARDIQRKNKVTFPSHDILSTFSNKFSDKNSESYIISSKKWKPMQRNVKRAMLTEINTDKESTISTKHIEIWAQEELHDILKVTTETSAEYFITWTTQSSLLIFTTTESYRTTISLPKFSPLMGNNNQTTSEYNEIEYVTDPDIDYYYENNYEYENNMTWYEYTTEETTETTTETTEISTGTIIATTEKYTTESITLLIDKIEDMTDITLNITITAETSISQTIYPTKITTTPTTTRNTTITKMTKTTVTPITAKSTIDTKLTKTTVTPIITRAKTVTKPTTTIIMTLTTKRITVTKTSTRTHTCTMIPTTTRTTNTEIPMTTPTTKRTTTVTEPPTITTTVQPTTTRKTTVTESRRRQLS